MKNLLAVAGLLFAALGADAMAQGDPSISPHVARFADHPTRCSQFVGGPGQLADSVGADYARTLANALAGGPDGARAAMAELRIACAAKVADQSEGTTLAERATR